MSVKKWNQLAEEKSKLNKQTEEIHQKFRMDKINKEFSQLSGEELFKPITKRLDEKSSATVEEEEVEEEEEEEEEQEVPVEFRPDAPTPAPSPPPTPPTPPPPYHEVVDDDNYPQPPPPLMEEKSTRKVWGMPGPVEPEYSHESTLLQTDNQLITKSGDDPNYKVKSKKSPLHGYSVEELKKSKRWYLCEKKGNSTSIETAGGEEV